MAIFCYFQQAFSILFFPEISQKNFLFFLSHAHFLISHMFITLKWTLVLLCKFARARKSDEKIFYMNSTGRWRLSQDRFSLARPPYAKFLLLLATSYVWYFSRNTKLFLPRRVQRAIWPSHVLKARAGGNLTFLKKYVIILKKDFFKTAIDKKEEWNNHSS